MQNTNVLNAAKFFRKVVSTFCSETQQLRTKELTKQIPSHIKENPNANSIACVFVCMCVIIIIICYIYVCTNQSRKPQNCCKIVKNKIYKSWILNYHTQNQRVTEAGKIKIETEE